MSNQSKLTASQRASLFAQATRQNMQMLPSQSTNVGATTLQFSLPKARLLSSILVNLEMTIKVKDSTSSFISCNIADLHSIIRRWSLDLNNGFSPFVIGGKELYFLNLLRGNKGLAELPLTKGQYMDIVSDSIKIPCSADGTSSTFKFAVELPVTLNDRDSIGLILLQNEQTNVTLSADVANVSDVIGGTDIELEKLTLSPMITTYSIPASADAFPDLSVLKLVNGRNDSFVGSGQHIIKLSTGTIYRRMLFRLVDENGEPFTEDNINGDIQLVFNQADVPYSISATALRTLNRMQLGYDLPNGVYFFDFAYQGIVNMGGTRDYIDSEGLSEFWIRFNSDKGGRFELVTECLARLQ